MVQSVNNNYNYLILEKSDGTRWLGVVESADASMIDANFTLDKTVESNSSDETNLDLYAPPLEYNYDEQGNLIMVQDQLKPSPASPFVVF